MELFFYLMGFAVSILINHHCIVEMCSIVFCLAVVSSPNPQLSLLPHIQDLLNHSITSIFSSKFLDCLVSKLEPKLFDISTKRELLIS